MSSPIPIWLLFVLWASCFYFVALPRRRRAFRRLPPGPPRELFIGNLRQMPKEKTPLVFHEWARKYGDVLYLELPGQSIVVLDSLQAAEDLLDKRSVIYSDRPKFRLFELFGWTSSLTGLPYGKKLAKHRQMHQSYLSRQNSEPAGYETCLNRFATGIITQIVSGHKIESEDDPYLRISKMALESLVRAEGTPGGTTIDFFPVSAILSTLSVKDKRHSGDATPSFILSQLDEMETWDSVTEQDEEDLKGTAGSMFAAGESTTWSALSVFVLAMVLHPECQLKAQEELDRVIGSARLPEFADRESLPYVECVYQEVFRWAPGVPLGVPHRCMEDNIYRGMMIPAGSIVYANIKGMCLDENTYSTPTAFSPERYLPKPNGRGEPYFPAKFGFGRRICTGQYLADNSIWIAFATLLAACTITNAVDADGNVIVPDGSMSYGLMSHPNEYQCAVKPRTAQIERMLMDRDAF
ncbi:Cytochrome P450 [Mycena venus]|uniref:Cytochrome P450 n=1 Tax=Mycena venus TaxID=2733690 RepID=A0A8H6YH37_9AGAR|nr:Cytochrome P450 [Mycena venus]